jgi:hypothetical protein
MKRPDYPGEEELIPLQATAWWRLKYALIEEDGVLYVAATEEPYSPDCWYQPLDAPPPKRQPKRPEGWQEWPHLHLARLDPDSPEDILAFANRWGLLGLWNVKKYRERTPPLWQGEEWKARFRGVEAWFSRWYLNPAFESRPGPWKLHRYREPVPAFAAAAEDFQNFVSLAQGEKPRGLSERHAPKNPDDRKSVAQDLLNHYLAECFPVAWYLGAGEGWKTHWQVPSLLHACYLLVWLDITGLREYRVCAHRTCRRIFVPTRPNVRYCSDMCQENAKRLRFYYRGREEDP